ncbi:RTC4-like domain-containing protein [Xylariomycetidae sp. FL0641]|nr:RTC4-like domain-containing protein [Xylariomycetidae sp. FL0641]
MNAGTKDDDEDAILAPPEASDEEDEIQHHTGLAQSQVTDSDEEEGSRQHDIKPTTFNLATTQTNPALSNPRRSLRTQNKTPSRFGVETPSSSAASKRSVDETAGSGKETEEGLGFLDPKKPRTKYGGKLSRTFGKSSQRSDSRSAASQSRSAKAKAKATRSSNHKASPKSPEPPHRVFKEHKDLSLLGSSPHRGAFKSRESSPESIGRPRNFIEPEALDLDQSPERSPPKFIKFDEEDEDLGDLGDPRVISPPRAIRAHSTESVSVSTTPQALKLLDVDDLDDLTDVGNEDANVAHGDSQQDSTLIQRAAESRCPMCNGLVDPDLLKKHSINGRMNVKKQTAFCRLHKQRSAADSGTNKGYPAIDWTTLSRRCRAHQDFLRKILEGTQPSHFASLLKGKVESGKNRTLLKNEDNLTPGYYGPRGLRVMTEYIMRDLSSTVRKRAIEDRLVSARGYTGYVQAVLVPELTVRLIMEDMKVSGSDARVIMQESVQVGELLHEDAGDVIVHVSDEEEL